MLCLISSYRRLGLLGFVGWIALAVLHGSSMAHPFHISSAEMEFNPTTGRVEVSLRLHSMDLEQAIRVQARRKVNFDKETPVPLIEAYLSRHFFLASSPNLPLNSGAGSPASQPPDTGARDSSSDGIRMREDLQRALTKAQLSTAAYVGHEMDAAWMTLYFELTPSATTTDEQRRQPFAKSETRLVLVNTVLLDTVPGQLNTVAIRHAGKRQAIKLNSKRTWHAMPENWCQMAVPGQTPVAAPLDGSDDSLSGNRAESDEPAMSGANAAAGND